MSGLLPRESPVDVPEKDPQVVALDDPAADDVFAVLSSEIARSILRQLYEEPASQSELADRVDTSIQNADYHLANLVDAGLITVVDQWYSEKGRTMDVYAPADDPLVLVAGTGGRTDSASQAVTDHRASDATPTLGD